MNRFQRNKPFVGQRVTGIAENLKINVIDKLEHFLKDDTQKGIQNNHKIHI